MDLATTASPDEEIGVTIVEVSQALGVPMPTLRSWEIRYGIPDLLRVSGKHRRYNPAELHALRLMRDEIARGHRAGVAAASVRALLNLGGPGAPFVHRFLDAAHRSDQSAMRGELDTAAATLGLGQCLDEVVLPGMRQIGRWWETGTCSIGQEHCATEAVRAWLGRTSAALPTPTAPKVVLLACGPMDQHTVGIEATALLLRSLGQSVRVLGARVLTAAAVAAVTGDVAAVILVSHLATGRRRTIESIQAVHELGVPVYYAGNAFTTPRSRNAVPGTYLGPQLEPAANLIIDALRGAPTAQQPRTDPRAS